MADVEADSEVALAPAMVVAMAADMDPAKAEGSVRAMAAVTRVEASLGKHLGTEFSSAVQYRETHESSLNQR